MAGGAAGQWQKMRDFVSSLFQGSPDLSILTHAIIRKKYLDHVGLENLSKQEKEQLKQLVEEELVQMKIDQFPSNVELRTETQDSFKSGDCKRPLHISHSLEDEIKNEQEQKRQKIEKKLEVSSDEKDSGIDSKKRKSSWIHHESPKLLRMFSDSSDQGDSGAGNHSAESESDEETTRSRRKPSLQEARGRGRKSTKGQGIRGSQKRGVSESEETTTNTGQSDLEEEVKEHRKITKGNSLKQRDFKKKVDKVSKATDPKGKAKNRMMNKQREERSLSEGGTDLLVVEEISGGEREWSENEERKSFSTNKAQQRMGPGTQKGSKGNESENASRSGSDKKYNLQKKMADSQCRRKTRVIEDLGSSSEDSEGQLPMRKEGAKKARRERGSQQTGNHSKPKRQPKERGGRENLRRKKLEEVKMTQRIQESTGEESESESGENKSTEAEKKWAQDPASSEGGPQRETNQGQPMKEALLSPPSESESVESEDGDPRRTLGKESKDIFGSDSSQEEEKLKKRGAQRETNQGQPMKEALISPSSESESVESEDGDPRRTLGKESKDIFGSDSSQEEEKLKKRGVQRETNQDQPMKEALISPPSESESDESEDGDPRRTLGKKSKDIFGSDSSQGEEKLKNRGAQRETNQGQLMKEALIRPPSESESDESEDGDPKKTLGKESKDIFGSDSSQGEEKLKNRGAQKSQRKSIGKEISVLGSEDLGSEFKGKKKVQNQQQRRMKKLQGRSATKEKQGEESRQEEDSSSEEDEPTISQQQHLGKDKKHHSGKNEEHPSIQRLKRYIRECGVRQNYKKLLAGCHSRKAQIKVLKEELDSLGIKGTPTLAKCKALKQKREEAAEVASLDINNIIATEGRPKRRKVWSLYNKPQESPSSPEESIVRHHITDWSQLRGVISSDGESS
ncbi:HIRA-interacting protein 3 [Ahaetulla prasina]|uniref:HIRA-interacting protein 3 n=1 Tax=Ahaetulla prasina TaxID=499056 RepID=UPI002647993D|nr:HIRA-interacting protein 3 [Ahaetulla prasina]